MIQKHRKQCIPLWCFKSSWYIIVAPLEHPPLILHVEDIPTVFPHYKELDACGSAIPSFDGKLVSSKKWASHEQSLLTIVKPGVQAADQSENDEMQEDDDERADDGLEPKDTDMIGVKLDDNDQLMGDPILVHLSLSF